MKQTLSLLSLLLELVKQRPIDPLLMSTKSMNPRCVTDCARKPARRDCQPNSKKIDQLEEAVIVSYSNYILDLGLRGFHLRTQLYVIWLIDYWLRTASLMIAPGTLMSLAL